MNNVAARFAVWEHVIAALGGAAALRGDLFWQDAWANTETREVVAAAIARCTHLPQEELDWRFRLAFVKAYRAVQRML